MLNFKTFITTLALVALVANVGETQSREGGAQFHAIAYHNIVDNRDSMASDDMTVETLINHFEWLVAHNYHPVSIEQLIAANKRRTPLPEKAVLLCWDDGYASFFTHVFPLLRAYRFPAVLAIVGEWVEAEEGELVAYADKQVPRSKFLSARQLRALARSPLVEIASHSFDLHRGLLADGAGDLLPAAITHQYTPTDGDYETDQAMYQRVAADLERSSATIRRVTGSSPRVMVWPFGRYNQLAVKAAEAAGMGITLTLDPVAGNTSNLGMAPRIYPTLNVETGAFKGYFLERNRTPLRRFVKVYTSSLLEPANGEEEVFDLFLERVKQMAPGRVYFEPVVGKGETMQAMFRNSVLPVAQDRLIRLTWHTNRRAGAETHLEMTTPLFDRVQRESRGTFFHEMGKSSPCSGILVSYDRFVEELLDELSGLSEIPDPLMWHPNTTRSKRQKLMGVSNNQEVASVLHSIEQFQYWQPFLDVGLKLYFSQVQSLSHEKTKTLLGYFDYIMVDLGGELPSAEQLCNLKETLGELWPFFTFMLHNDPESDKRPVVDRMAFLAGQGIVDYGYAYDLFVDDSPALHRVTPYISAKTYPFTP